MSVRIVVSVTEITEMNPKDRYFVEGIALSTEDVRDDGTQGHENETDPLESLSPLAFTISRRRANSIRDINRLSIALYSKLIYIIRKDPPGDSVYMICGVLIAMALVGVIIVLLAVTISKLRKREEHHSNVVHPEAATVVQTATVSASSATISTIVPPTSSQLEDERCSAQVTIVDGNSSPPPFNGVTTVTTAATTTITTGTSIEHDDTYANASSPDQFVWQFPPPSPPPQYTLYNDQDALVHTLPAGRPGFAKGFRKNFGGHWRRLVKRKPETETCAIPPELKDQLKTIYVY